MLQLTAFLCFMTLFKENFFQLWPYFKALKFRKKTTCRYILRFKVFHADTLSKSTPNISNTSNTWIANMFPFSWKGFIALCWWQVENIQITCHVYIYFYRLLNNLRVFSFHCLHLLSKFIYSLELCCLTLLCVWFYTSLLLCVKAVF